MSDHLKEILFTVGDVEVFGIAAVVFLFIAFYSRRNWRANAYGRALMHVYISLASVIILSLLSVVLGPDYEFRAALRALLFLGVFYAQVRIFWLLVATPETTAQKGEPRV